jgi:hypothetical protein
MTANEQDRERASAVLEEWAVANGWAPGAVSRHPVAIEAVGLISEALSASRAWQLDEVIDMIEARMHKCLLAGLGISATALSSVLTELKLRAGRTP